MDGDRAQPMPVTVHKPRNIWRHHLYGPAMAHHKPRQPQIRKMKQNGAGNFDETMNIYEIIIHFDSSAVSLKPSQVVSNFINFYQFLSIFINFYQFLSIFFLSKNHFLSIFINFYQFLSIFINFYQLIKIDKN